MADSGLSTLEAKQRLKKYGLNDVAEKNLLERDLLAITRFLTIISLAAAFVFPAVFLLRW